MSTVQENVSKLLSVLSHPLRRDILLYLNEKVECSFTDLMNSLGIETGKLSFHIRTLKTFLQQTPTGKYRLSKIGENAIMLIRQLEAWATDIEVTWNTSALTQASLKKRTFAFLIDLAMGLVLFVVLPNAFYPLTYGSSFILSSNLLLGLVLFWAYSTLLEGFAGQTIGKRIIGLKAVKSNGKTLSYDHAAVRNFGKTFLLPFDLLLGLRIRDQRYIRYFDKFSGTTVVDVRKHRFQDPADSS